MPFSQSPFRLRMLASDLYPRYAVRDARRPGDRFFTGRGWSANLGEARLYSDPEQAFRTVNRLTIRHLRRHRPKRVFLMTVVVRAYVAEGTRKADIERYLGDALVVGVNYKQHGTGPTPDSLVEVVPPLVISLEGR